MGGGTRPRENIKIEAGEFTPPNCICMWSYHDNGTKELKYLHRACPDHEKLFADGLRQPSTGYLEPQPKKKPEKSRKGAYRRRKTA